MPAAGRAEQVAAGPRRAADDDPDRDAGAGPRAATRRGRSARCSRLVGEAAEEVARAPQRRRGERQHDRRHPELSLVIRRAGSRPGRRAGSRGRARPPRRFAPPAGRGGRRPRAGARPDTRVEAARPLLDQSQPEMDVTEQPALLGLTEGGPRPSSTRAADIVQERGGEEEIAAQARVQLRRLAAQRRDADRVLEQPAGVAVVTVRAGGRERPERRSRIRSSPRTPATTRREPGMGDLAREEVEEAVELVRVAAQSPASAPPDRLSGAASTARTCTCSRPPNRSTRPSTRTASPSAKRPSRSSTSSQMRASMRPLASTSSSAR